MSKLTEKGIEIINRWISEFGVREAARKIIDNRLARKVGITSADLADSVILTYGLDEMSELMERGDLNAAANMAKDIADDMLEDEGFDHDMMEQNEQLRWDKIPLQTEEEQLSALNQYGAATLEYIIRQNITPTEKIQLAAIKMDANQIMNLINAGITPSEKVQWFAVKDNPNLLDWMISKGIKPSEKILYLIKQKQSWNSNEMNENKITISELKKTIKKLLKENDDIQPTDGILNGMNNEKARRLIRKIVDTAYHTGIYKDDSWEPIRSIFNSLRNANIDFDLIEAKYDNEFPPKYKTWRIYFDFVNDKNRPTRLYGFINASGAGSVEDPLGKYDITFSVS